MQIQSFLLKSLSKLHFIFWRLESSDWPIKNLDALMNGHITGFHPLTQKLELQIKNSLIIRKEKTKENFVFMSVFIFDKDTAKIYVQYYRRKSPQI